MRLKNENDCLQAIEEWKSSSHESQVRNLRMSIETMELDLMYYENKGSEKSAEKISICLEILNKRLAEVRSS